MNEWSSSSAAPVCLNGLGGENITFFLQPFRLCFFVTSLCSKVLHVHFRWIISESWHKEINYRKYSFSYRPRLAAWFMQPSNKWSTSQRKVYITCRLSISIVIRNLALLPVASSRLATSSRKYCIWRSCLITENFILSILRTSFLFYGAAAQRWPWPPQSWGF